MIETANLLPPPNGPMANPLLFGVAAGLAAMFPPAEAGACDGKARDRRQDAAADGARMPSPAQARR